MAATDALVFDAIRTPRGKGKVNGSLHSTKPVDLVVGLMHEMLVRNEKLDPNRVDDVVLGCVSPVGDQGADIAKTAAIKAGLPDTVAGVQLNRFCASGLEAVNIAAQKVASGWEDLVFAGGVESMSRVPMGSDGGPWAMDPETNYDTSFVPQGISADLIATVESFSREDVDAYAARSQERAAKAREEGRFDSAVIPVRDLNENAVLEQDEFIRPGTTVEKLATLKPAFRADGQVTAGNSCPLNDGAAAVIVMSDTKAKELGITPLARIVASGVSSINPEIMGLGPIEAVRQALKRANMTIDDIGLVELNEAFAAQVIPVAKHLGITWDKLNVNGGAIALGHPFGMTGARIMTTLLNDLEDAGKTFGLETMCVGGGQGMAMIVERLN